MSLKDPEMWDIAQFKFSVTGISGNGGGTSIFPRNSHLKLYTRDLVLHQLKSSIYS